MKILLVGNGAREHIIAEKLKNSSKCDELIVFADKVNPKIRDLATIYHVGNLTDREAIKAFANKNKPDFAVIGPEAVIANGTVNALNEIGVPSASPTQKLGQLESSKGFTRNLLNKYGIEGNPEYRVFTTKEGLAEFCTHIKSFVVKADGLHGGKGVHVMGDHFETIEEGVKLALDALASDGQVVIEEKLIGQEFSLMSFVDGKTIIDMPVIQDHKRAFEGDTGPNTGGMGTYNFPHNLPFLTDQDVADAHAITVKVAEAMKKELDEPFIGIMYGGFIAVKNGVRLIEYNARFGDPEAMNALTLLKTDLVDIFQAMIEGNLADLNVEFDQKATVCKYVVPEGYPTHAVKGEHIEFGDLPEGVRVYFASVNEDASGLLLGGSRTAAFVAVADNIEEAEKLAQRGVESVSGPVFYRKDIGTKVLIQKRVDHMKAIRG